MSRTIRRLATAAGIAALLAAVTPFAAATGALPGLARAGQAAALPGSGSVSGSIVSAADTTPDFTMVGAAFYDVIPGDGRVAVRVELTATNHLKDTKTKRYFFRTAFLTVLPNTENFKLAADSGKPKVSVTSRADGYTNLKLDLGADLGAGKSTTVTLTFDVVDPGGAPDRPVRISPSLVSFNVWAFATPDTPGATVAVQLPAEYDVTVDRGPLTGPETDDAGLQVWLSGELASPLDFVADVRADRPSDFVDTTLPVAMTSGAATIVLRAWPDDPEWRDRMGDLVARALPELEDVIGVPWPIEGPLAVREALTRGPASDAGVFRPAEGEIDVAYAASDLVVIHELAHAWFNGALVGDRWIAEAFASHYAALAAEALGLEVPTPAEPPSPTGPGAFPLNAWGTPGATDGTIDDYGYAASQALAGAIAARAGEAGLRAVWAKASTGIGAYQPAGTASEPAPGPPDWRGLLDLLEQQTGLDFADLWRTWVVRTDDLLAMGERAATIGYYRRSVELAAPWRLPPATRAAMRAWRFELARDLLVRGDALQAARTALEADAELLGVTLPGTLRERFEGQTGLEEAAAEATAERVALDAIAAAVAARPPEQGVGEDAIVSLGLATVHPEASLAAARDAFERGDLRGTVTAASTARDAWSAASQVGRSRIISAVLLTLAIILLIGLVRQVWRRTRLAPARS